MSNNNGNGSKRRLCSVRRSSIQGKGVFALQRIQPGRRVIEYRGERISSDEEAKRYDDDNMDRHHTFLFEIDDEVSIDGNSKGNAARYINHSCDPNCEAVLEEDRVFIEAIKNIQPGVELSYDYNYQQDKKPTRAELAKYVCYCGAAKCRGTILAWKDRRPRRRRD